MRCALSTLLALSIYVQAGHAKDLFEEEVPERLCQLARVEQALVFADGVAVRHAGDVIGG